MNHARMSLCASILLADKPAIIEDDSHRWSANSGHSRTKHTRHYHLCFAPKLLRKMTRFGYQGSVAIGAFQPTVQSCPTVLPRSWDSPEAQRASTNRKRKSDASGSTENYVAQRERQPEGKRLISTLLRKYKNELEALDSIPIILDQKDSSWL